VYCTVTVFRAIFSGSMWRAYQEGKLAECDAFEANDEEFELKVKGHVPLALMAGGIQAPVQVVSCTNQSQVSESLGEVSQVFAA
jgi:hypothetical protein